MSRRFANFSRPNDTRREDAPDAALAASFPACDPLVARVPAGERSRSTPRQPSPRVDRTASPRPQRKDVQS